MTRPSGVKGGTWVEKVESGAEWVEKVESSVSGRCGRQDQVGRWSQRRVGGEGQEEAESQAMTEWRE